MRLLLALGLALTLAACDTARRLPALGPGGTGPAVTDRSALIVLTDDAPETLIARGTGLGYTLRAVHPLPDLDDTLVVFGLPRGRAIPEAIDEIEAAVPGVTAGADHVYRLQLDAATSRDYAARMIGWPAGGCRARARVGIVDSGVRAGHPGFGDGRIVEQSFTGTKTPPVSNHGTLMAELLVGPNRLRGAPLYSANVIDPSLGDGGAAGVTAILRGIDWLAANDVDLVNFSLAGPRNKLMNRALGQAAARGMVIVAAVGNLGPREPPQYPAAFPFVLAVTAVDRDGAIYRKAVRGRHVDIAAPGVDVLVPQDGRLTVTSGTSVAAPFVTGIVAADPSLAGLDVAGLRAELARRAVDLGEAGPDRVYGAGLVTAPPEC